MVLRKNNEFKNDEIKNSFKPLNFSVKPVTIETQQNLILERSNPENSEDTAIPEVKKSESTKLPKSNIFIEFCNFLAGLIKQLILDMQYIWKTFWF